MCLTASVTTKHINQIWIRQNLITNYIFKGPIIYSRGRLYILNGVLSLVNSQIEIKIIIQKIKVKTSGLVMVNAKHLITYSWSWRHSDSTVWMFVRFCENYFLVTRTHLTLWRTTRDLCSWPWAIYWLLWRHEILPLVFRCERRCLEPRWCSKPHPSTGSESGCPWSAENSTEDLSIAGESTCWSNNPGINYNIVALVSREIPCMHARWSYDMCMVWLEYMPIILRSGNSIDQCLIKKSISLNLLQQLFKIVVHRLLDRLMT